MMKQTAAAVTVPMVWMNGFMSQSYIGKFRLATTSVEWTELLPVAAMAASSAYRRFDGNIAQQTRLKTSDIRCEPTLTDAAT